MEREELKSVVERLFEARLSNNADRILTFVSPDCAIEIAGAEPNDAIRRVITASEVVDYVRYVFQIWHWVDVKFGKLLIDGDTVAMHYTLNSVFTPTNEDRVGDIAEFITFKDGLVTDALLFVDTEEVSRLMKMVDRHETATVRIAN